MRTTSRGRIRDAVLTLHRLDDELAELAESLALPETAEAMWEWQIPSDFNANLYAAVDAVRSDCIQDAIRTLQRAARHTEESLRQEFLHGRPPVVRLDETQNGGVSFQQQNGNNAKRKETPPC